MITPRHDVQQYLVEFADSQFGDARQQEYQRTRIAHWNDVARRMDTWRGWSGSYYRRRLTEVYRFLVAPNRRVLEVGCGRGDLLAALNPSVGVGVDFSSEMIQHAKLRHPQLEFIQADVHCLDLDEKFDVIVLSDLVNDLWDVQTVLERVAAMSTSRTRLILNSYSRLWELPLGLAEKLGVAQPTLYQNWLTVEDIANLMNLAGFEVVRNWTEILFPFELPGVNGLFNKFLVKLPLFWQLALTNFMLARPKKEGYDNRAMPSVSVIVPARNEAGNIARIFARVPNMGSRTELVFVEGHSKDNTYQAIEEQMAQHPDRSCKLFRQTGVGKGDAVRLGFSNASGDVLMILDADLTVPPEDLPRFYNALVSGKGEFINGVRLVYPMEAQAMRFANLLGNKFFSLAFSWLLGQPIKDTLCGTKVLWKKDYDLIAANRAYFGDFDPFGDYDLIFGAAKLGLKIVDLPIRYRERTYGTTNIQRWKHGWLLLQMVLFAAARVKFV